MNVYNNVYMAYYISYLPGRANQIASEATSLYYTIDSQGFDYSNCFDHTVYVYAVCALYNVTNILLMDRYVALQSSYDFLLNVELAQRATYAYVVYYEYKNKIISQLENVLKNFTFTYQNIIDYLLPLINRAYTDAKNRINLCVAQNVGWYYVKLNTSINAIVNVLHNVTNKHEALNNSFAVSVIDTLITNLTTTVYNKSKLLIDNFVDYSDYIQQIQDDYNVIQNSDCSSVS